MPIQKMITVPILLQGEVVGVARVSRKGENSAEAGPDFTTADVNKAQDLFSRGSLPTWSQGPAREVLTVTGKSRVRRRRGYSSRTRTLIAAVVGHERLQALLAPSGVAATWKLSLARPAARKR